MHNKYNEITHLHLLRHGECQGGAIFRGSSNVELSARGFAQMQASCDYAGKTLNHPWDVIISSPLARCRYFAEHFAKNNNIELVIDERIREMSFGDWDGQLVETVWRDYEALMTRWSTDPASTTPPNGEPMRDVAQRLVEAYSDITQRYRGKKILLVMHGGVIRVLLTQLLNMPLSFANRFEVPYANLTGLNLYHGRAVSELTPAIALSGSAASINSGADKLKLVSHNMVPQ